MIETAKNEPVEAPELKKESGKYQSKAKSIKGLILGLIQRFKNDARDGIVYTPKELEKIFEEVYSRYTKKLVSNIVIEKIGFQRDGHTYNIYKGFDNDYRCWIYEAESPIIIEKDKINFILQLVLNCEVGQHYGARYFFRKIIQNYNLDLNCDEFSGGRNRTKFYVPLYLAPMKIIEKETRILKVKIGKGGGILRVK